MKDFITAKERLSFKTKSYLSGIVSGFGSFFMVIILLIQITIIPEIKNVITAASC